MLLSSPPDSKRIASLDVLRGLAISGMVLVHVAKVSQGSGPAHEWWRAAVAFFATGKFYTIFALLFGISFGLELSKRRTTGSPASDFLRRLACLAIIMGALKLVFGSSLLYYAIWGAPLVLLHRLRSRWLVAFALALLSVKSLIASSAGAHHNIVSAFLTWTDPGHRGPFVLAMFIAGLLAVRHGLVTNPAAHRSSLAGIAAAGMVLSVMGFRTSLGVTYAAGALLFVTKGPRVLALIGRASLSNYALHLVALHALFEPGGLGLTLDWRWTLPVSALVFGCLAAFSAAWLHFYQYGPLEWLWRGMYSALRTRPSYEDPRPSYEDPRPSYEDPRPSYGLPAPPPRPAPGAPDGMT